MKLIDNKVVMSRNELSGILLRNEKLTERANDLLRATPKGNGKRKRVTMSRKPRNLRVTDHQPFKLLRVAPEFADTTHPHGKILSAWAQHPNEATLSIAQLLTYLGYSATGEPIHHPVLNVENPLAWVRQTVKQAVLRGDAEPVAGEANTESHASAGTAEQSAAGQENTPITSGDTQQSDDKDF